MNRVEFLFSNLGLVVVGLLVLSAVFAWMRLRARRGMLDPGETGLIEAWSETGRSVKSYVFPGFQAVLEQVVLPRATQHPDWERLDGAVDVPGRTVAKFDHEGATYSINGESRIAALVAALEWMRAHPGENPLVTQPHERGVTRLTLRPDIGAADSKSVRIASE